MIYSWSMVVDVVTGRYKGDVTAAGAHIAEILIFAIIAGIGSCLILPIFAFVPFNARRDNFPGRGRRFVEGFLFVTDLVEVRR